ncbi:MAG: helix-turn-helix domain-containing protein [Candidatus Gracilibacteria bacterium]|nr:helix-turn-helix domain-containing protein [Candidatus Gracilibacteria bacterium]
MQSDKIVDNSFLQRYIGLKLLNRIKDSGQTISKIAEKLGYSQPYLSRVLSGKDTTLKRKKIEEIAFAIGLTKKELNEIIKQAKKEEYMQQFGEELLLEEKSNTKNNLKSALQKQYGIQDNEALEDIENFVEYIKLKYK